MRSKSNDPLFMIFEQYLYTAIVENESHDDFCKRVVTDYVRDLKTQGSIPPHHISGIEADLREEVFEMLRKKTYGHYSLQEFREKAGKPAAKTVPSSKKRGAARRPSN